MYIIYIFLLNLTRVCACAELTKLLINCHKEGFYIDQYGSVTNYYSASTRREMIRLEMSFSTISSSNKLQSI